jgi:hypothetical protein
MLVSVYTLAGEIIFVRAKNGEWRTTIALGDVVEFEILPLGTAACLCTKDKYNLPMFSDVCQAETKAQ